MEEKLCEMQSIKLEMQDNQLKIKKLENNPNEETSGRRINRENRNDKRNESIHMPRDDDDEIVRRIKVDPPTFDGVHEPNIFSDRLLF